jgi:hypothetical protein
MLNKYLNIIAYVTRDLSKKFKHETGSNQILECFLLLLLFYFRMLFSLAVSKSELSVNENAEPFHQRTILISKRLRMF